MFNGSTLGKEELKLHILERDLSEKLLYEKAHAQSEEETGWESPPEWQVEALDIATMVKGVSEEARKYAQRAYGEKKAIGHTNDTYHEVYDKLAEWAIKFQILETL